MPFHAFLVTGHRLRDPCDRTIGDNRRMRKKMVREWLSRLDGLSERVPLVRDTVARLCNFGRALFHKWQLI